jgi:uncharacterized protein YcsI (UPF0317 family)
MKIELRPDDAEPILFRAAFDAAKYGSYCDYITGRVSHDISETPKQWREKFLSAKRVVEAFGIEYEQVSEEETLTVAFRFTGGKTKVMNLPGIGNVGIRSGSEPDYTRPYPLFRSTVHNCACEAAAQRVIQKWRASLS